MTQQEILNSNLTKTKKAEALFELGFTRLQVADLVCNGNRGFSYNIWKKWNENRTLIVETSEPIDFEFEFSRKFGVEIEFFGPESSTLINNFRAAGLEIKTESYKISSMKEEDKITLNQEYDNFCKKYLDNVKVELINKKGI